MKFGDRGHLHRPCHESDGPNTKLQRPWHGLYSLRAQLSPVIYRVSRDDETAEITVHLGRTKSYVAPTPSAPDFEAPGEIFSGRTLPVPDLDGSVTTVALGPHVVEGIGSRERGGRAASTDDCQCRLRLKDNPSQLRRSLVSLSAHNVRVLLPPTVLPSSLLTLEHSSALGGSIVPTPPTSLSAKPTGLVCTPTDTVLCFVPHPSVQEQLPVPGYQCFCC